MPKPNLVFLPDSICPRNCPMSSALLNILPHIKEESKNNSFYYVRTLLRNAPGIQPLRSSMQLYKMLRKERSSKKDNSNKEHERKLPSWSACSSLSYIPPHISIWLIHKKGTSPIRWVLRI